MRAPVTVGIPTYARGERVFAVLEKVLTCDPPPAEVIVHVDASDGELEKRIAVRFPQVRVLSSAVRVGPGGGRHRCLLAATQPYFASFDDDSWPVDTDYFQIVDGIFKSHPKVAVLGAAIWHRHEEPVPRRVDVTKAVDFTGCGFAMRVAAYRGISGYVDRPIAYGVEEVDISLQLHAAGWQVLRCGELRVFHDTQLVHHATAEITAGTIQNAALLAWLCYPPSLWGRGVLQTMNVLRFMLRQGRRRGIFSGLMGIPHVLWRYRRERRPLPASAVREYLASRRSSKSLGVAKEMK